MDTKFFARRARIVTVAALCVLLMSLVFSVAAASADPVDVRGDATYLRLDPGVNSALLGAGILVKPLDPATVDPRTMNGKPTVRYCFAVTGGIIDPASLAGTINHSGGLLFLNTANGKSLQATDFRIDTAKAQLLGLVGDAYVPLLDLDLSGISLKESCSVLYISNVVAKLTDVAAGALNATLGTDVFAGGLTLGTATVHLRLPTYGATVLCVDQPISQALAANGIMVLPVRSGQAWTVMPVWMAPAAGFLEECFSFPIKGRQINSTTLAGKIWHSGGLTFYNAANGRSLKLTSFTVNTAKQVLTADVGGSRVAILDLDLSAIKLSAQGDYSVVGNVGAALTEGAAMALNNTLKTDLFAAGLKVGEATVSVKL